MADNPTLGQVETIEPAPPPTPLINELDVLNINALNVTGTITGNTFVGGTLETATTNPRLVISTDVGGGYLAMYDSSGTLRLKLGNTIGGSPVVNFYDSTGHTSGTIYGDNVTGVPALQLGGGSSSNIVQITATDVLPLTDNTSDLGNNTYRWALVRGVTITSGDLAWEETHCYLCQNPFSRGDKLCMVVKKMVTKDGETLTHTVPICKTCFLVD